MALGIIILFVGTSVLPAPSSNIRKMESVNSETTVKLQSSDDSMLDMDYIYNLTENLSKIIFTEYNESAGEIAKGREFGTKGEQRAAEILFENMTNLGLYTWKEPINNSQETLYEIPKVASKIEILEKGLVVKKISDWCRTPVTECYFSPRWNLTGASINPKTAKLVSLICRVNGILDKKYHLFDEGRLTYNFSHENLRVKRKPYIYSLLTEFIRHFVNDEPFVYIDKDRYYCNWSDPEQELKVIGPIFKKIFNNLQYNELVLWTLFQPNCKGLILFDSNNDTYNMAPGLYRPLPIIRVNGTIGKEIYDNPDDFRIDFYMNQQWYESVNSSNVIGQINCTNSNETVIVSCLYDCLWNQGTADSAIGMAIILGIAKYMKEQNITPKCNVRFIGFCGEEYGARGAYYHEVLHRNENISMIIDLNQLGFNWTETRLTLAIYTNNESLVPNIYDIANRTDYVNRTGNVTNFITRFRSDGGPPSHARIFADAKEQINRLYNTILFVKEGKWYFHHKDGLNHKEGDVLDYFDRNDTSVTSEMIWNVTKYFTVKPDS